MERWYIEKGPDSDVVISSRVRFARNFKDFPFPIKMSNDDASKIIDIIKSLVPDLNKELSQNNNFFEINEIESIDRQIFVEKHLISPEFAEDQPGRGILISDDEQVSIMVNEEDHLRIQCLSSGIQLDKALKICNSVDEIIERKNEYAFNEKFGYLTSCPTNVGTGIRASVMLHLPALTITGYIKRILEACSKVGIIVRGLYGENTEASGNMFQVSNQITLGQIEEDIVHNVVNIVRQIVDQERALRNELYQKNSFQIEDKICRSYGLLANARIITSEEAMKLLSDVRLGVDLSLLKNVNILTVNELTLLIQPATLQKIVGVPLNDVERNIKRAEIIRSKLQK